MKIAPELRFFLLELRRDPTACKDYTIPAVDTQPL
jgi:hypothetical protein